LAIGLPLPVNEAKVKDHLIKEDKQDCGYCHSRLSGPWESVHEGDIHYKRTTCGDCSKDVWIKAGYMGDGHDSWNEKGKPEKSLDDHITEIESIKIIK